MAKLNNDLTKIITARNSMKSALASKGQTVTNDIRTYAEAISNIDIGTDTSDATAEAKDIITGKTAYGANGKLTGTFNGAMIFNDIAEMEACQTAKENDLGLVYGREEAPIIGTTEFQQVRFPAEVTLSSEVTSEFYARFRSTGEGWIDMNVYITSTSAGIDAYGDSGELYVQYTSSDGIHYTREEGPENYDLGTTVIYEDYGEPFDNRIGQFILAGAPAYNGLYQYLNYTDPEYIRLIPASSLTITKATDSSTMTGVWDGTWSEHKYSIEALHTLVNNIKNSSYSTLSSFNMYFALDTNNSPVLITIRQENNEYTYSDGLSLGYTIINNVPTLETLTTNTSTTRNIMEVFDVDLENMTYQKRNISIATGSASNMRWFYFVTNTVPVFLYSGNGNSRYWWSGTICKNNYSRTTIGVSGGVPTGSKALNDVYLKWQICPTQFTLSSTDDLFNGIKALGYTGVITGTFGNVKSANFDDNFSKIYTNAQEYYDTLEPVVLQDGEKFGTNNTYIIPTKSDGTSLLDISNMTDVSYLFNNLWNVVEICALDTSNVTNAQQMFCENNRYLKRIKGELDTSNVTNAKQMFEKCTSLKYINNSDEWTFDFSNCTDMSNTFEGTKARQINLTDTSNVTRFWYTFKDCKDLVRVTGLDMSSLLPTVGTNSSAVSYMFGGCENLEYVNPITLPNNVQRIATMFDGCKKINNTNLPISSIPSSVTSMDRMLAGTGITSIPNWDFSNVESMSSLFSNTNLTGSVSMLNINSAQYIDGLFGYCKNITAINLDIPNVRNLSSTFIGCSSLSSVSITNSNGSGKLWSISSAFQQCTSLVTAPNIDTSYVENSNMNAMFYGCSSLENVPEYDTHKLTQLYNIFSGCPNLTDTSLNNILNMCRKSNVTSSGYKTLKFAGLTQEQATRCQSLSNYSAFTNAGWTTGY